MKRVATALPALKIDWTQTTADHELYEMIAAGELDLGFTMLPAPAGPFAVREVLSDPFVAMVAPDSVLARRCQPLSLRDLFEVPLVAAKTCRSTNDLLAQARERGAELHVVLRTDDNGTVCAMVARGEAAALVPRLVGETANGGVSLLPLEDAPAPRRIALAWHASRDSPPVRLHRACRRDVPEPRSRLERA